MAFKQYLKEAEKAKTVAVLFGRMNPPTSGHEENVEGLKRLAKSHNADHLVIASHSHDAKKNPLTPQQKLKHLKRAFPGTNVTTSSKEKPTLFHHLSDLHSKGYTHVVLAAGSDRAEELHRIKSYNGKEGKHGFYNFKSITTASTGERKAGVSGTDMRKHATNNDFASFRKGLPNKLAAHEGHAKELFHDVRSGMGLHEIYDPHLKVSKYQWGEIEGVNKMKSMTPGEKIQKKKIRESYVSGNLFKLYENVYTKDGREAKIVFRGSNYLTLKFSDGNIEKKWLDDVMENKTPVTYKSFRGRFVEQKIPVLLMNDDQKKSLYEQTMQLSFDGISTKNFDMCADAYKEFKNMIEKIRAGELLGEPSGHAVAADGTPAPNHSAPSIRTVETGMKSKPTTKRRMQFKQYLDV
jgi:hypothetical protein